LAALPAETRELFCRDLRLAQDAVAASVVPGRAQAANNHWLNWSSFCQSLNVDPFLQDVQDPVVLFQVYLQRYRTGAIAPRGKPVRSRTVEDSLRAIGQTFAALGASDPRLDAHGNIDFRIQRQLRGYSRVDPPPNRVKPIPVQILRHVVALAAQPSATPDVQAVADMITLAFFFLLRPGEYTGTASDTTPFTLHDVQCWIGQQRFLATTIPLEDLPRVTFVSLTFTTQKNGVRGEVIGLGRSGNPVLCPVHALTRRIAHLRSYRAPPNTPLAAYFITPAVTLVKPADITDALRCSTALVGPSVGFLPSDISAPCAPQVRWPYYVLKSTRTSSVCSVVGVATKCSAIFTYKPSLLCGISPAACSPEARSHSCPTKKFRSDNFIPNSPQACFTPGSLPPVLLAGFPYKATWCHFPILLTIGKQVEWHVPL
jgi:hypothetical protein